MKQALIIGASGGIGSALARRLGDDGWDVTALSRSADGFDVTDQRAVDSQLGKLEGGFDLVIVASGGLEIGEDRPEKSLRELDARAMARSFALNAIGPALVLAHAPRLLPRDRRSVFAALSARVGSIGDNRLGGWYSYRASKAALNQIIRTGAIELARTHRDAAVLAVHPGTVTTPLTARYLGRHPSVPPEVAAGNILGVLADVSASDSGTFVDWAGKPVAW